MHIIITVYYANKQHITIKLFANNSEETTVI